MRRSERVFLGQDPEEVRAAMIEEDASHCMGCPFATIEAAAIVSRTEMLWDLINKTELTDGEFIRNSEDFIEEKRDELRDLTIDCNGYSTSKREHGRPAKICDSPKVPISRYEIMAGKIMEFLHL